MNKQITDSLKKILNSFNTRIEKLANYDSVKTKRPLGYDETSSEIQASMADSQNLYTAMASENAAQFSKLFNAVDTNAKNIEGLRSIVFDSLDRKIFTKEDFENVVDVAPEELQKVDLRYDPETNRMHSTREEDKNKMVSFDVARQKLADIKNAEIQPATKQNIKESSEKESIVLDSILNELKRINTLFLSLVTPQQTQEEVEEEKKSTLLSKLKPQSDNKDATREKDKESEFGKIFKTIKRLLTTFTAGFILTALPTLIAFINSKREWIEENITTPTLDFFMETIPTFFSNIGNFFTETIPTFILDTADKIGTKISSIGDAISKFVAGVRNKLANILESVANGLPIGKSVSDKILNFAAKIRGGASDIAEKMNKDDAPKNAPKPRDAAARAAPDKDIPEATKIDSDGIKRLRKIEDQASKTNDEFKLVDLASEYLQIIGKENNDQNVEKLVNQWLDKYYGDGYSSGAVGKNARTGEAIRFSMADHNQERAQRNNEPQMVTGKAGEAGERPLQGEQVATESMAATDPSIGVASKPKDGRTTIPGGRTGMSGSRTTSKGQKFKIDSVPNPNPNLSHIKDQIFATSREAA